MKVSSEPSTSGICAEAFNCKILLAAVPTSTFNVPFVVMGPPSKPVPLLTVVTLPVAAVVGVQDEVVELNAKTWLAVGKVADTA